MRPLTSHFSKNLYGDRVRKRRVRVERVRVLQCPCVTVSVLDRVRVRPCPYETCPYGTCPCVTVSVCYSACVLPCPCGTVSMWDSVRVRPLSSHLSSYGDRVLSYRKYAQETPLKSLTNHMIQNGTIEYTHEIFIPLIRYLPPTPPPPPPPVNNW